jgi:hypothetical protein
MTAIGDALTEEDSSVLHRSQGPKGGQKVRTMIAKPCRVFLAA